MDIIEELKLSIDWDRNGEHYTTMKRALAEIGRLRAALTEIATFFDSEPGQDSTQTKMAKEALNQQLPEEI
jgi:hypothetical protein